MLGGIFCMTAVLADPALAACRWVLYDTGKVDGITRYSKRYVCDGFGSSTGTSTTTTGGGSSDDGGVPAGWFDIDDDGEMDCYKDLTWSSNPTKKPLPKDKNLGSNFGGPNDGSRNDHNGVDISAYDGDPVIAPESGKIVEILTGQGNWYNNSNYNKNGNYIRVNYDDGSQGVFLHLKSVAVKVGDRVRVGSYLGRANNTGRSRGTHLHYTNWKTSSTRSNAHNPEKKYGGC